jgi:hypothetical protein
MPENFAQAHPDRLIAALATRQHGVVSRRQLLSRGLSRHAIDERIRTGQLHSVHQGVYAVGLLRVHGSGLVMAAVLACGEGAVASHRNAGAIWCVRRYTGRTVDVTVPTRGGRRRSGIRIHRSALTPEETTMRDCIPVTKPARTLVDLADILSRRALERAFDEAEYLRLDCTGLKPIPGRPGHGRLIHVLHRHDIGSTRTRSGLEDRFLEFCDRHGLTRPLVNTMVHGYEVDFYWADAALVVEVDSLAAHGTRKAFEVDRLRDADLAVAGYRVLRVTEERLESAPDQVAMQIAQLLRQPRP